MYYYNFSIVKTLLTPLHKWEQTCVVFRLARHFIDTGKALRKRMWQGNRYFNVKPCTGIFLLVTLSFIIYSVIYLSDSVKFESIPAAAESKQITVGYTVNSGDTLWLISQKYDTTVSKIKTYNNLTDNNIYPGQQLTIPVDTSPRIRYIDYKVIPGNTLSELAEYFGTSVENIKIVNRLKNNIIYAGKVLRMPASCINYIVVSGNTLWKISNKHNTTVSKIKMFNSLTSNTIYAGQMLHIPYPPAVRSVKYITHTVQSGETLWSISIKYGIPQYELESANQLTGSAWLSIGQKLRIPVYYIPVKPTPGAKYGEYLDWWKEAQYIFPIGKFAKIKDFVTGKTFNIKRSIGANHADCEPLTSSDSAIIKNLWDGKYSWITRAVIVEVNNRKIAASMSSTPHGIQYDENNNFSGHFDIHFKNSTRHKDGEIDTYHQEKIRISAGIQTIS